MRTPWDQHLENIIMIVLIIIMSAADRGLANALCHWQAGPTFLLMYMPLSSATPTPLQLHKRQHRLQPFWGL
jgi:hypothetical protein